MRRRTGERWRRVAGAVAALCLLLTGVIHLLPGIGVLGAAQLQSLYQVEAQDPALLLLLRHRAVLLALVGVVLLGGAAVRAARLPAIGIGLASVLSFLLLAGGSAPNAALQRVAYADWLALAALIVALAAHAWSSPRARDR